MDWSYASAGPGNVAAARQTALDGTTHTALTLALGFGPRRRSRRRPQVRRCGRDSLLLRRSTPPAGPSYLASLKKPPAMPTARERAEYRSSEPVLAASEDKTNRGAFVASPTMPWAWGTGLDNPYGRLPPGLVARPVRDRDRARSPRATPQPPTGRWTYLFSQAAADRRRVPAEHAPSTARAALGRACSSTRSPTRSSWPGSCTGPAARTGRTSARPPTSSSATSTEDLAQDRAVVAAGALGEPVRLLTGDHRRARSPALVTPPPSPTPTTPTREADQYLAVARHLADRGEEADGHHHGPVQQPAVLPAAHQGRPAGQGHEVRHRRQRPERCRPAHASSTRRSSSWSASACCRRTTRSSSTRLKVVDQQLVGEDAERHVLAPLHLRRVRRDRAPARQWDIGFKPGSQTTNGRAWPIFAGERGEYNLLAGKSAASELSSMAKAASAVAAAAGAGLGPYAAQRHRRPSFGHAHAARQRR